jgi:hypothetical protein
LGEGVSFAIKPNNLDGMIDKGWVEQRGEGNGLCYRITDKGMAAKTMPVPVYK